jgi:hypothetical protein
VSDSTTLTEASRRAARPLTSAILATAERLRERGFTARLACITIGALLAAGAPATATARSSTQRSGLTQHRMTVPPDRVSWWPGDGDPLDHAGANDATPQNGATFASGVSGQAFSFDGIDDSLIVADSASLNPSSQITIDAWVYETGTSNGADLIGKDGETTDRQYLLTIGEYTQRFRAHVGVADGFEYIDGATPVAQNTWYHVAMTYDGATLKVYVNGALDGSLPVTGAIIQTTQPLRIGGGAPDGAPPYYLRGQIDEAELYDRALTADEIRTLYLAQPHATETALASDGAATWGRSETFSATVTDAAEPSLVPSGSVRFASDGAPVGDPVPLDATGKATFTTSSLAPGQHHVVADFIGDPGFRDSSGRLDQSIGRAPTTTMLTSAPNPTVAGEDVTFVATVAPTPPVAGAPTGSVQFSNEDGSLIGTPQPVDPSGKSMIVASAGAGRYRIHANYLGDANLDASEGVIAQKVDRATTTTQITSSQNPVAPGATVTFTVNVSVNPPGNVPTFGTLVFTIDGATSDPIPLEGAAGVVVTATAPASPGTTAIGVAYSGDENTTPSSDSLNETVEAPPAPSSSPTSPSQGRVAGDELRTMSKTLTRALKKHGLAALNGARETLDAEAPGTLEQLIYSPQAPRSATSTAAANLLIASARHTFGAAARGTLRVRVTRAGKRKIAHAKSLKLAIVTRFTPVTGATVAVADRVTVKRSKGKSAAAAVRSRAGWRDLEVRSRSGGGRLLSCVARAAGSALIGIQPDPITRFRSPCGA